jgi:hypothetical protein
MPLEDFQLPPNSNQNTDSLTIEDIQNTQIPGYVDSNQGDIIAKNQEQANIVSAQPDPYSQSVIDTYNAQFQPQAIGPQGASSLYPGMALRENMGTYSGSIVGSNPLMAPGGGVMAIDPVLARRKAIEDAAKQRASSLVPFEPPKPFQLTDPRFQKKYEEQVMSFQRDFTEGMKDKYGKDWTVVAKDPNTREGREFIQAMANYETLGREFNAITDRVAAIDEGLESGELEFSDDTLKEYDDYKQLIGNFEGGDVWKSKDLQGQLDKLDGFLSLESYINDNSFLDNIMGEKGAWSQITDQGEYYQTSTGSVVKFDDAIDQVADSLARGPMRNAIRRGYMDIDKIKKTLQSKFKTQRTAGKSMSQKSKATRDAETIEIIADADAVVRYADEEGKRGQIEMFSYDDQGNRLDETWSVGSLFDFPVSISGKKKTINERLPDGKIQKRDTKGISLDNVRVITPDGKSKNIPGKSIVELDDSTITKLEDGRMVAKARVLVPTKTTIEGDKFKGTSDEKFDSYTAQDQLVYLESSDGKGIGGTLTQLRERGLSSDESKTRFNERLDDARKWKGSFSSSEKYEIQGKTYSLSDLESMGYNEDQVSSYKK